MLKGKTLSGTLSVADFEASAYKRTQVRRNPNMERKTHACVGSFVERQRAEHSKCRDLQSKREQMGKNSFTDA